MARVKLPYDVVCTMDALVNKEVARRMLETGDKVYKIDVLHEIAKHSGVKFDNIKRISRNVSLPSIGVALKIAEYFNVDVNEIFKIS